MNDKKLTGNINLTLIISVVVLVVYNVIAFVVPVEGGNVFWISYVFQTIAIILSALVALYASKKPTLKSLYLGVSLLYVAISYLTTELVIGTLLLLLPSDWSWISVIVQVLILATFIISVTITDRAKTVIEEIEEDVAQKRRFVQLNLLAVEGLIDTTTDDNLRKKLQNLAETIKYSDPMSADELVGIEAEIDAEIVNLQEAENSTSESTETQIAKIDRLLKRRNREVMALK